jgi:hypothetical protein
LSESLSISFSSHPKFLSIVRNIDSQIGKLVGFSPSDAVSKDKNLEERLVIS